MRKKTDMRKGSRFATARSVLLYLAIAAMIICFFGGCSKKYEIDSGLIGTWKDAITGHSQMTFQKDGTIICSVGTFTGTNTASYNYSASEGKLKIYLSSSYKVLLEEYTYTLGFMDGKQCLILKSGNTTKYYLKVG